MPGPSVFSGVPVRPASLLFVLSHTRPKYALTSAHMTRLRHALALPGTLGTVSIFAGSLREVLNSVRSFLVHLPIALLGISYKSWHSSDYSVEQT